MLTNVARSECCQNYDHDCYDVGPFHLGVVICLGISEFMAMEAVGLSAKVLPPRRSALSAQRSLATQLDTDSSSDDSDDDMRSRNKKKGKQRVTNVAKPKVKEKANVAQSISAGPKLTKSASRSEGIASRPKSSISYNAALGKSSEPDESITPRPRPRPKPTVKKKAPTTPPPPQPLSMEDDMSDLTSIGSSRDSRSPSRDSSVVILDATIPSKPHSIPGLSSRRDKPSPQRNSSSWSLQTLGSYVWVLLDPSHNLVFNPEDDHGIEDLRERLWWPAKVCIL